MNLKVYTKTGDKGLTSLFGGKRVSKNDLRVEAYGTVDELNAVVALALTEVKQPEIKKELMKVHNDLFLLGSILSGYKTKNISYFKVRVEHFEKLIDLWWKKLPELHNFVLPSGGKAGAQLHFCRTLARRAERRTVQLSKKEKVDPSILIYFNRLSDLLFTMARYCNYKEKRKEIIWVEPQ